MKIVRWHEHARSASSAFKRTAALARTLPHQPHEFFKAAALGDPAPLTAPPPGWDKDAIIASRRKELARLQEQINACGLVEINGLREGDLQYVSKIMKEGEEAPQPMSIGSSGNFGKLNFEIAVSRYSPDGLRSAMSATHPALEAAIKEQDADQLITYAWEPDADEILADLQAKGLPPTPGAAYKWTLPESARQAQW